jgi:hypothetical protein
MRVGQPLMTQGQRYLYRGLIKTIVAASFLVQGVWSRPAQAEFLPYCQQTAEGIARKETARQAALKGDKDAQKRYKDLVAEQAKQLRNCRSQNWLKTQALWLRLYPCDIQPGALEEVLDRIVDRGYNQINVEVFYNGQVLLPQADNPTAWSSVVQKIGAERVDLLEKAIQKGRERGLSVYAWLFSMNFGYPYAVKPEKQASLAKNGRGQTSLTMNTIAGLSTELGAFNPNESFIDPYSLQARQDYAQLVDAIAKRRPDGILFDYIRYPRGTGAASISSKVKDLWIYGSSAQQAILLRSLNDKGRELIQRFTAKGSITPNDVAAVDKLFPNQPDPPLWQGRSPISGENKLPLAQRHAILQLDLWRFSVAHAMQGVVDFLSAAVTPVQKANIPAGAVFFPEGNQNAGSGFDSRLQPWDRFPAELEWHPMSYGVCGNTSCIVSQVQRVLSQAPPGTRVKPVLAGIWQQSISNRPPLEIQMEALRQVAPQISSISHFAYSWQEPKSDRDRKACQPRGRF